MELLWPLSCVWVSSSWCSKSQNGLIQVAYGCNHMYGWMMICCVMIRLKFRCVSDRAEVTCTGERGHSQRGSRHQRLPADVMNGGSVHLENLWIVSHRASCWCHPLVRHKFSTLTADHVSPSSTQSSGQERSCQCLGPQENTALVEPLSPPLSPSRLKPLLITRTNEKTCNFIFFCVYFYYFLFLHVLTVQTPILQLVLFFKCWSRSICSRHQQISI